MSLEEFNKEVLLLASQVDRAPSRETVRVMSDVVGVFGEENESIGVVDRVTGCCNMAGCHTYIQKPSSISTGFQWISICQGRAKDSLVRFSIVISGFA